MGGTLAQNKTAFDKVAAYINNVTAKKIVYLGE